MYPKISSGIFPLIISAKIATENFGRNSQRTFKSYTKNILQNSAGIFVEVPDDFLAAKVKRIVRKIL